MIIRFFLLLFGIVSMAQNNDPYKYYDAQLKSTVIPKDVAFYSILEFDKSIMKNSEIIFYPSGKVRRYQQFSDYSIALADGMTQEFYENGILKSDKVFIAGKINGSAKRYWTNGKIMREDEFDHGKWSNGKCFDIEGNESQCLPYEAVPEFPGGQKKFYDYILKSINKIWTKESGTVFTTFMISKNGTIGNIKILRGINEKVDAEIIKILTACPKWSPGIIDGELTDTKMSLPIKWADARPQQGKPILDTTIMTH